MSWSNEVFSKNLTRYMKQEGITQKEIAKIAGVSAPTVNNWIKCHKYPRIDRIEKIALHFGIRKSDLIEDKSNDERSNDIDIFSIPGIEPLPEMEKKPLLGTIACGEPILAEENIEDYIPVPKSKHCDFLLRCKGNSMIGARVHDGDLVCIRQQPTVENGEIAAVLIENEATLKRFYRYGDTVVLRAENLDFPDLEYKDSQLEGIRILGKATHFISKIK